MKNHFKLAVGAAVGTIVTKITEDRKKEPLTRAEAEEQICAKMYTIPPEEVLQVLEDLTDQGVIKLLEVLNNCTNECKNRKNECTCDDGAILEDKKNER